MTTEEIMQIIEGAFDEKDIPAAEIPGIDLYMDQITTLFDEWLTDNRRSAEEKLITKTMINNYSKEGLLNRIAGKKYSKEHMLMMLVIYNLKQGLTIQDISSLLEGISPLITDDKSGYIPERVLGLYDSMLELKDLERQQLPDLTRSLVEQTTGRGDQLDAALAVVALTCLSNLCRRAAERLIDTSFPKKKK